MIVVERMPSSVVVATSVTRVPFRSLVKMNRLFSSIEISPAVVVARTVAAARTANYV